VRHSGLRHEGKCPSERLFTYRSTDKGAEKCSANHRAAIFVATPKPCGSTGASVAALLGMHAPTAP
jgi:hypothetical protein